MTDIYSVLNLAGKALLIQQKAINVTGNNIANVNTPGYSRQKLKLQTSSPLESAVGLMGSGVEAIGIERVYNRFLGIQINAECETLGRWETQKDSLEIVEALFAENADFGLSRSLNDFWTAWQDLSNDAPNFNERMVLQAKGSLLASSFNRISADLQKAQEGIDLSIEDAVGDINQLSQEIADLNEKIMESEAAGHMANDYRDQRDLALRELAELIDINSFEDASGRVAVSVGAGQPLVESNSYRLLATHVNASGFKDIDWIDVDGAPQNITASMSNGKMKGWLESRDAIIDDYLSRLDDLAGTLMREINIKHASGFGLDESTGHNFFTGGVFGAMNSSSGSLSITGETTLAGSINITLVGGGMAGSELVTTDPATGDITVAIEDGVSTGAQIAAALQAHADINSVVATAPGTAWTLGAGSDAVSIGGRHAAAEIQVNPAIVNNLDLIAAASTRAGVPGDNSNAIAIANLQYAKTMNSNSLSFDDYYHSLVSEVGSRTQNTTAYYRHQSNMVVQMENRREAISGVSLDEEMINLVKFQNAYDAAAKLISTTDELLQTVLNMV
jgi:flagellar hook-associated protein 1 FlgK